KKACVGGMVTKIEAAKIAMDSGIPCVIANGRSKDIILSLIKEPDRQGTLFIPKKSLKAREHWIAFGTKPKGKVIVDEGAKRALLNNKSLLSVGVTGVTGDFQRGDIVVLTTPGNLNTEFARGKVEISSKELNQIKGKHSEKEAIHCDNIVIVS
ncbi:MAG: glutamate 5-kinase, partial [Candidatus Omnitrophica bacterium]|nr:glutamate 5-kinase [Candidatus Omnitrophota bacterium]